MASGNGRVFSLEDLREEGDGGEFGSGAEPADVLGGSVGWFYDVDGWPRSAAAPSGGSLSAVAAESARRLCIPCTVGRPAGGARAAVARFLLSFMFLCAALQFLVLVAEIVVGGGFASPKDNPYLGPGANALMLTGALDQDTVHRNQWWRLFTAVFVHEGLVHYFFNMLVQLRFLGPPLEHRWGTVVASAVYVATGIAGNVASLAIHRFDGFVSCGASGALMGLCGVLVAEVLLSWNRRDRFAAPVLWWNSLFVATTLLLITMLFSLISSGVDGVAHAGGFTFGALLGTAQYASLVEDRLIRGLLRSLSIVFAVFFIVVGIVLVLSRPYLYPS
jgi:membrane associated rhomboid family serine protease